MKKLLVRIIAKNSKEVSDSFTLDYIEDEDLREIIINEMLYNYAVDHHYNVKEFFSTHYRTVTDYVDSYDLVAKLEETVHNLKQWGIVRVVEIQLPCEMYKTLSGTPALSMGSKIVTAEENDFGWFIGIKTTMHPELKKIRYVVEEC